MMIPRLLACVCALVLLATNGCEKNPTGPTTSQEPPELIVPEDQQAVEVLVFEEAFYPVYKFRRGGPEAGCIEAHWHSDKAVPSLGFVDDTGQFVVWNLTEVLDPQTFVPKRKDPDPTGCGHGTIAEVQRVTVIEYEFKLEVYYEAFGGPE